MITWLGDVSNPVFNPYLTKNQRRRLRFFFYTLWVFNFNFIRIDAKFIKITNFVFWGEENKLLFSWVNFIKLEHIQDLISDRQFRKRDETSFQLLVGVIAIYSWVWALRSHVTAYITNWLRKQTVKLWSKDRFLGNINTQMEDTRLRWTYSNALMLISKVWPYPWQSRTEEIL